MTIQEQLHETLRWRYATKVFDPAKHISGGDWQLLKDSLRLSPSSYGLQPWKFIHVQNQELRARLREASFKQGQVTDCSHFVVLASLRQISREHIERHAAQTAALRGLPAEKEKELAGRMAGSVLDGRRSKELGPWAQRQAYIAMGFAMLSAALLGIDSCPMEGIEPERYDEILGLEGGLWGTLAGLALGYRAGTDGYQKLPKVRFSEEDVFSTLA
jgi:nitroreductase